MIFYNRSMYISLEPEVRAICRYIVLTIELTIFSVDRSARNATHGKAIHGTPGT